MRSAADMSSQETHVYDIIFAGGGAAACVTAGRLAAADPSLKILIVEAGPHIREVVDHIQPARCFKCLTLPSETFTFHKSKPVKSLGDREPIASTGRALGGGSSVNFTMYTRAAASDYDAWETVHGNKGWHSKYIIPLLKKAETYQPEASNDTHGTSGPIKVSFAKDHCNVGTNFLEVATAYDKEHPLADDINDMHQIGRYGRWARYIDERTGRRSDTPHHYIYNQENNTGLKVIDRHRVVRVIFEGTKAVGIEFVDDSVGRRGSGSDAPVKTARASRLVVVSAGAFGSPSILERSGIGAKSVLEKNGINQIVNLPGVGENYMDHNVTFLPFVGSEDSETADLVFRGTDEEINTHVQQWVSSGSGQMAQNGLNAGIKLQPNEKELAAMSPEFDERWKTYFKNAPDKPVIFCVVMAAYVGANPEVPRGKYYSMTYFSGYPVSTGSTHIAGGLNPYTPLDFYAGLLDEPADVVILRWAYKKFREIARRMKFFRGELILGHPNFPPGSAASTAVASDPVDIDTPDIVYTKEDDEAIDEYHRKFTETAWHSVGTCSMKPREKGGVLNERLNVYGVEGLKVADCSIAPGNVGANTYNTAIAIGEKAAIIIAEDLGIKGVTPA